MQPVNQNYRQVVQLPKRRRSHRIWPWAVLGVVTAAVGGGTAYYHHKPQAERDQLVPEFRDACGNLNLHLGRPAIDQVISCSPYIDQTTQKAVIGAFTINLIPHSAIKVSDGFAVGAQLQYKDGIPRKIFDKDNTFTLKDFDDLLTKKGTTANNLRDYCQADMSKGVTYTQAHSAEFANDDVSDVDIGGHALSAYDFGPGTNGNPKDDPRSNPDTNPNDQKFMYIYMSDGPGTELPTDPTDISARLVTCWKP